MRQESTTQNNRNECPVLLIIFNRPETTAEVLSAIADWQISTLYIAADGPRENLEGELDRCLAARETALRLSSQFRTKTLFQTHNLGCAVGVSTAINWFFENETEGIILEDDCVPNQFFFGYCNDLLARYRDDPKVMMISGNCFLPLNFFGDSSYLFMRTPHIWGWATWKQAWDRYQHDMAGWDCNMLLYWLQRSVGKTASGARYWTKMFYRVSMGEIDTWDYRWASAIFRSDGLAICPASNLVDNIGFSGSGTHTNARPNWLDNVRTADLERPLNHPSVVEVHVLADDWTDRNIFCVDSSGSFLRYWTERVLRSIGLWKWSRSMKSRLSSFRNT